MKVVIIDDEAKARRLLSIILSEYCPQITSIHEGEDLTSGVQKIREEQPDIVFLDIEMPDFLGIEIGNFLSEEEMNFHLVFTTAYSDYAIKAFEVNAVDYLLKPIRPQQIKDTVDKIAKKQQSKHIYHQLLELKESLKNEQINKIGIPVSDGILFIKIEDIICITADGMYTQVYTNTHEKAQMIAKPLKYFVSLLENNDLFYRSHRSSLINLNFVQRFINKDGYSILMDNEVEIPLARDKKDAFLDLISNQA